MAWVWGENEKEEFLVPLRSVWGPETKARKWEESGFRTVVGEKPGGGN